MTIEAQLPPAKKPIDQVLTEALTAADSLELDGERGAAVKLAVKALLVIRGALSLDAFKNNLMKIYPSINKYVRASNQETLAGIVDDVLHNISPEFITRQALGTAVAALYTDQKLENEAVAILKEETIPIVLLMKSLYQKARGSDEADPPQIEDKQ